MAFIRDVADGVHVITRAHTNMFLIEDQGRLLFIDAGLPAFWSDVKTALTELRVGPDAIAGVLLTHAHFDHVGCAHRLHDTWHVPIWVHTADQQLAAHPYSYRHELPRWNYPLTHPAGIPKLANMTATGALTVHGITDTTPLPDLAGLPGSPVLVETPGHTDGHVAFHLPERDVLFTGDALVTLDPYTGHTGPQIVAGAATADSTVALASLRSLEQTGANTALPGHGGPWRTGIDEAVARAVRRGAH